MDCHDSATQNLAMTDKCDSTKSTKIDSNEALTSRNDSDDLDCLVPNGLRNDDSMATPRKNATSRNDDKTADSPANATIPATNAKSPLRIWAFSLLIIAIFTRIYQYAFHKDLWLDEALLAFNLFGVEFSNLFFAPLANLQSAPLLFLLFSKAIGSIFGYGEHSLYFLPFVCGIATLFLALKIGQILFGKNSFGLFVFIVLVCGSLGLLHYTTEFKQYGIEAFVGFLLVYLYLLEVRFWKFIAVSVVCMLFSHTGIFVALAVSVGYVRFAPLKDIIKNNRHLIAPIAILLIIFLLYYMLYVRFQAVENFYDYWSAWLIPLDITKLPSFFVKILPVWSGFTPFDKSFVIPIYMLISAVGLYALHSKNRPLFRVCLAMLTIYITLSLAQIYPFGHNGIIGGRLSLYMSVFFYVPCAFGAEYLYARFSKKWWKIACNLAVILLIVLSLYRNAQIMLKSRHHIQQTHDFITQIAQRATLSDCIFVYDATKHTFLYYSHLDRLNLPFVAFSKDNFKDTIKTQKCEISYIIASHYTQEFADELIAFLGDKITIKRSETGWDTMMISF